MGAHTQKSKNICRIDTYYIVLDLYLFLVGFGVVMGEVLYPKRSGGTRLVMSLPIAR